MTRLGFGFLGYNFLMQINAPIPDFSLPDTHGQLHHLDDYRGRIVIVNFWSAECPWSERADSQLALILKQAGDRLVILPVASNRNESLEFITETMRERGLDFVLDRKSVV